MRIGTAFFVPALFVAFFTSCVSEPARAPVRADAGDLEGLRWLVGSWEWEGEGRAFEEHWIEPRGGTMLGVHRDLRGGRTVSWEFMAIEERPDGVFFVASPKGQPQAAFRMVELREGRVVFENPAHDFPQRILYWLEGGGNLRARIEGVQDGVARGADWSWRRVRGPLGR